MRLNVDDVRTWCVAAALFLTAATLIVPRIELSRSVFDVVAVVDITGSMLTRDMETRATQKAGSTLPKKHF